IPRLYNGKDRSFFMFNYEGFRLVRGSTYNGLYPSRAQLGGNLADDSAGTGLFPTNSAFCLANAASPKCVDIINYQTGVPFAGNVIPANLLNAQAKAATQFIPAPNVSVTPGTS